MRLLDGDLLAVLQWDIGGGYCFVGFYQCPASFCCVFIEENHVRTEELPDLNTRDEAEDYIRRNFWGYIVRLSNLEGLDEVDSSIPDLRECSHCGDDALIEEESISCASCGDVACESCAEELWHSDADERVLCDTCFVDQAVQPDKSQG